METIWSRALGLLKWHGWRQGPGPGEGGVRICLTEALSLSNDAPRVFVKEVCDHLGLVYDGPGYGLGDARPAIQWNDAPERTFVQVERLLTELHEKELAERGLLHGTGS